MIDDKEVCAAVERILDGTPAYVEPTEPFQINWGKPGVGFGQLYFYFQEKQDDSGLMEIRCANELMGKEFIKEMLCNMVDGCELDD